MYDRNSPNPMKDAGRQFSLAELLLITPLAAIPFGALQYTGLWGAVSMALMGMCAMLGQGKWALLFFCVSVAVISLNDRSFVSWIVAVALGIIMSISPLLLQVIRRGGIRDAPRP